MNALLRSLPIIAILCFAGCTENNSEKSEGRKEDEDLILPQNPGEGNFLEPQILDFSGFQIKSFESISWEKKCEGIGRFIEEYAKAYLDGGVRVLIPAGDCTSVTSNAQSVYFFPRIDLTKEELKISLEARVIASLDQISYQLSVNQAELARKESETVSTSFGFNKGDELFGENLRHLEKTLATWALRKSTQIQTVFDLPYEVFVKNAEKKYGLESSGLKIEGKRPMTFNLLPAGPTAGVGTVKFLHVDSSVFNYIDKDGNEASRLFMRCPDIECLNEAAIRYEFLGNSLILSTPAITEGGKNSTEIFKLMFTSWE